MQSQYVRHVDDGADEPFLHFVFEDSVDEGLVDLQRCHRQTAQISQRRIAGAKIIERQFDAKWTYVNSLDIKKWS